MQGKVIIKFSTKTPELKVVAKDFNKDKLIECVAVYLFEEALKGAGLGGGSAWVIAIRVK